MANKVQDGHHETKYGEIFISPKVIAKTAGLALQHDGNKVISLSLCTDGENTFILPAGGFLTLGILLIIVNMVRKKLDARMAARKEAESV